MALAKLAGMLACFSTLATANAQVTVSVEKISFDVTGAYERGAAVAGELRIPGSGRERLPAVVIVNSSPGFDGRGASYAKVLNQAGIATLEIDMFHGRGLPVTARHNMPHAFQSLQFLARHPRIDEARVGIMGFSWGGTVSVLASSAELTRKYGDGKRRFAAHLGLYPVCWTQLSVLEGRNKHLKPTVYRQVTGSPVHILVGDKDDYDAPDGCSRFLAALPTRSRRHFSLTVYSGATFAWDSRFSHASFDPAAKKGKGGTVDVVASSAIANQSRTFAAAYFQKHLASAVAAEPSRCSIVGAKIHWVADYCMSKNETDDEIAASDCINAELKSAPRDECAAKRHYKKALCELAMSRGHRTDGVKHCIADPAFAGSTVRNGGVGR